MTSLPFQLPDDIQGCHALIEQLRVELHAATERIAKLQSEADESRDAAASIGRLDAKSRRPSSKSSTPG